MAAILVTLVIGLPWLGAVAVWFAGNKGPNLQNILAVAFSVLTAVTSLVLLRFASADAAIRISFGASFGELTFVPDGLAVSLTAIAAVVGSLAVVFSKNRGISNSLSTARSSLLHVCVSDMHTAELKRRPNAATGSKTYICLNGSAASVRMFIRWRMPWARRNLQRWKSRCERRPSAR